MLCGGHGRLVKLPGGILGEICWIIHVRMKSVGASFCHCYPLPRAADENHRPPDLGFIFASVSVFKNVGSWTPTATL